MDFIKNVAFIEKINTCVKAIMADGKINKNDIPTMVFLVCELITSSNDVSKTPVTTEQMTASIDSLYNYIMLHYNLYPADELQKLEFKAMFDMCVKLALFQPTINKRAKSLFACVRKN
jgi:hypothetical protein